MTMAIPQKNTQRNTFIQWHGGIGSHKRCGDGDPPLSGNNETRGGDADMRRDTQI